MRTQASRSSSTVTSVAAGSAWANVGGAPALSAERSVAPSANTTAAANATPHAASGGTAKRGSLGACRRDHGVAITTASAKQPARCRRA